MKPHGSGGEIFSYRVANVVGVATQEANKDTTDPTRGLHRTIGAGEASTPPVQNWYRNSCSFHDLYTCTYDMLKNCKMCPGRSESLHQAFANCPHAGPLAINVHGDGHEQEEDLDAANG